MAQDDREENCRQILVIANRIAKDVAALEDRKEAERIYAQEQNKGYSVKVDGLGEVAVSAPTERKFKGIVYVLDQEAFLDGSTARRQKLIDDGWVNEEREYQPARNPSVTVRL